MEGKGEKILKEKEVTGKWKMPPGDSKTGKEGEESKKKREDHQMLRDWGGKERIVQAV